MSGPLFTRYAVPSSIRTLYASFSGGADSLALLLSLADLRKETRWELRAVHFEHGIRGEESLADAEFCRNVCEKLGVPLEIIPLDVPQRVWPGEGIEAAARRLRQKSWQVILSGLEMERKPMGVALGHNADDRIESLFLRLMRGSNTSGLNALHAKRKFDGIVWLRPLLDFTRADIEAWLAERGVKEFRTDSTNLENEYDRNKLRNIVLPTLYREFPHAKAGILTAIRAIADDAVLLDDEAEDAFNRAIRRGGLDLETLAKTPHALLPRVLRRWLDGQIPDRHLVERLRDLLEHPDRHARSGRIPTENCGAFQWRNGLLRHAAEDEPEEPEEPVLWDYRKTPAVRFGKTVLRFRGEITGGDLPSGADAAVFDAETFPRELIIVPRMHGDFMTPFGSDYSVTLKKIFTDAHVPASEQPLRPVVRDAENLEDILWVPGVRRSASYPVDPKRSFRGLAFSSEPLVDVTAAIIGGPDGQILVCSRPAGTHMAGKWEFPGGKIESGESAEACIRREIREELGMEIAVGPVFTVMEHDYGVKYVRVTFFLAVSGDAPSAKDGQGFRWVTPDAMESVDFLDADRPVSAEIKKNTKKITDIYNKMRTGSVNWVSKQP